jgi:hypothetical protein
MYLDIAEINKEIKAFKAARKLFMQQDFLDFIGRKCIKVLQLETALKAPLTRNNKMNDEFATGHTYQTQTLSNTSRIILSNNATNQFGEYFSAYIEYGTGIYAPMTKIGGEEVTTSTRPNGWIYPTDEADRNPTKKYNKNNGTWYAFTWGQVPKNVYTDALKRIEENMDSWIEEYMKGG